MNDIDEWAAAQQRVMGLAETLSPAQVAATVPACPDWTVRNLLSHMIGLGADVVRGDEPDDHNSTWTQAQVDQRADHDVPALLAEWRALTGPLSAWMREHGTRPLNDIVIHEQDLRGAIGIPGAQDTPGLHTVRDRLTGRFAKRLADLPPIALIGEQWRWTSAGDPAYAAVAIEASDFDLTRAIMSRRSAAQLRAWTTRGDIEAHLDAFRVLGPLPVTDLTE